MLHSRVLMLTATLLLCFGCNNSQQGDVQNPTVIQDQLLSEEQLRAAIVQLMSGDITSFQVLPSQQREQVAQTIFDEKIYPDDSVTPPTDGDSYAEKSLPDCGGYLPPPWSWQYESIEQRNTTSGLLYEVGPNCCMVSPGQDCGTDYDDYMLSFYFGRHNESIEQLRPMLKWYSTHWLVRSLMGNMSARVYQETPGSGVDNYEVKCCIDDWYYPYFETFRMRKYSN